jgi:hypothetical protein
MSILDRMEVENRQLQFKREEDPHGARTSFSVTEGPNTNFYNGFTYEKSWKTELKVTTMWYANDAQFNLRYDIARKEILHQVYGPVLHRLNELRARAYDRDYLEVLRVVDEIEKELVA